MSARKILKLKDSATNAFNKGKFKKALQGFKELEEFEAKEPRWSQRVGDTCRRLNNGPEAASAYARAAEKYASGGFLVKAIAMCKLSLQLDPNRTGMKELLSQLNNQRGFGGPRRVATATGTQPAQAISQVPSRRVRNTSSPVSVAPIAAPPPRTAPPAPPPLPPTPRVAAGEPIEELDVSDLLIEDQERTKTRKTIPPGGMILDVDLASVVPGATEDRDGVVEIPLDNILLDDDPSLSDAQMGALQKIPLFSEVSPQSFSKLMEDVEFVEFDKGQDVFKEGDKDDAMYVVVEGKLQATQGGQHLADFGEGDFFGEVSLLTSDERTATISVKEDASLLKLTSTVVHSLIDAEPQVLTVILRFVRDRLFSQLMDDSPLFDGLMPSDREHIAGKFRFLEMGNNTEVVRQGERAEGLFVLLAGRMKVTADVGGVEKPLGVLGAGDMCGEMSLLNTDDAIASVTTITKSFVLQLPASDFRTLIMTHPQLLAAVGDLSEQRREEYQTYLSGDATFEATGLNLV